MKPSSIAAPGAWSSERSGNKYATSATTAMSHHDAGAGNERSSPPLGAAASAATSASVLTKRGL
jgi:hypothetical protein